MKRGKNIVLAWSFVFGESKIDQKRDMPWCVTPKFVEVSKLYVLSCQEKIARKIHYHPVSVLGQDMYL